MAQFYDDDINAGFYDDDRAAYDAADAPGLDERTMPFHMFSNVPQESVVVPKGRPFPDVRAAMTSGVLKATNFMLKVAADDLEEKPENDLDSQEGNFRSPLHIAALAGNPTVMEALLAAGGEAEVLDSTFETPLSLAYRAYRSSVVSKEPADIQGRRFDTFNAILALQSHGSDILVGVNPNVPGTGTTVLHLASQVCDERVVGALLAAGAAVKTEDGKGVFPIQYALARATSHPNANAKKTLEHYVTQRVQGSLHAMEMIMPFFEDLTDTASPSTGEVVGQYKDKRGNNILAKGIWREYNSILLVHVPNYITDAMIRSHYSQKGHKIISCKTAPQCKVDSRAVFTNFTSRNEMLDAHMELTFKDIHVEGRDPWCAVGAAKRVRKEIDPAFNTCVVCVVGIPHSVGLRRAFETLNRHVDFRDIVTCHTVELQNPYALSELGSTVQRRLARSSGGKSAGKMIGAVYVCSSPGGAYFVAEKFKTLKFKGNSVIVVRDDLPCAFVQGAAYNKNSVAREMERVGVKVKHLSHLK